MMELTVKASVVIPEAPDHLMTDGGMRLPLSALNRYDLGKIGQAIASDLLAKYDTQCSELRAKSKSKETPPFRAKETPWTTMPYPPGYSQRINEDGHSEMLPTSEIYPATVDEPLVSPPPAWKPEPAIDPDDTPF
jgi:hypothetical protein